MAKEKTLFSCTECGDSSPKWLGKCPGCGAWNTLIESSPPSGGQNRYSQRVSLAPASSVATLADIEAQDVARTPTGQEELEDRKSTRLNSSHSQQSRMPSSA